MGQLSTKENITHNTAAPYALVSAPAPVAFADPRSPSAHIARTPMRQPLPRPAAAAFFDPRSPSAQIARTPVPAAAAITTCSAHFDPRSPSAQIARTPVPAAACATANTASKFLDVRSPTVGVPRTPLHCIAKHTASPAPIDHFDLMDTAGVQFDAPNAASDCDAVVAPPLPPITTNTPSRARAHRRAATGAPLFLSPINKTALRMNTAAGGVAEAVVIPAKAASGNANGSENASLVVVVTAPPRSTPVKKRTSSLGALGSPNGALPASPALKMR